MSDRGRFSPDRSSTGPSSDGLGGARLGNDAMPGNTGSPAAGLADLPRQTGTDALADQANEAADAAIDAALSAGGALEAATAEIAEVAKEAARATLRAVSAQASELASNVTGELTATAETQKDHGAAAMRGFAKAIRTASDDLDAQAPEIARHFRGAAGSLESLSDNLRSRSVGDLFGAATDLARKQPAAFFAGAVVAGFALSRFLKSTGRSGASTQAGTPEVSTASVGSSEGIAPSAPSNFTF